MDRRQALISMGGASMALLTGCNTSIAENTNLRLLNLQAGAGDLQSSVNGSTANAATSFETVSGYTKVSANVQSTVVSVVSNSSVILSKSITYVKDQSDTLVIAGTDTISNAVLLNDDQTKPSSGYFSVRIVNLATRGGSYDVYITAPTATLAGASPTASAIADGATGLFFQLTNGDYRIRITTAGSSNLLFDSATVTFASQEVVTLVLYSVYSGALVNCFALYGVNSSTPSTTLTNLLARVKFVNGAAIAARLRAKVAGVTIFGGIPTGGVSSYQAVGSGSSTLSAETDDASGTLVSSLAATLKPGRDYTVIIGGVAGAYTLTAVEDNNIAALSGYCRLRVVNAVSDAVAADVFVNYRKDFASVAANGGSSPVEYAPATYAISALIYDSAAASMDFGSYELVTGLSYVLYLFGLPGSRSVFVTQNQ